MENWEAEFDKKYLGCCGGDYCGSNGGDHDEKLISFIRELVAAKPCGDCLWSLETPCKKHE